jgi:hypothetical protein
MTWLSWKQLQEDETTSPLNSVSFLLLEGVWRRVLIRRHGGKKYQYPIGMRNEAPTEGNDGMRK